MIGRLKDLSFSRDRTQTVSITLKSDFCEEFDRLKDSDIEITIKKYRPKRSLDANAYAWVLAGKIAEHTGVDKNDVYREAVRGIGGVYEIVCVRSEAYETLKRTWETKGIGWMCEEMPSKIDGCKNAVLYYGSSCYDTKQMSALLDHLIQDAQAMGIPTDTPDMIAERISLWGK